ncbi:MAG: nitronate monooxygenase, partial [Thermocrispum sp.]
MTPAEQPGAALTVAVSRAGGLGVLDLGGGDRAARQALGRTVDMAGGIGFGIRVPAGCALTCEDVAQELADDARGLETVILGWDAPWRVCDIPDRHLVLVEVTSWQEALIAAEQGADGVIARGAEAGGRVGETATFVLLQQLLARPRLELPVWVCGGIGPQTAAAAVVGGAAGVVLDTQLALLPESELPDDVQAVVAASDGTDTEVLDGRRVLTGRNARLERPLPVGQDAFLAKAFAETYGHTARAVRAVRAAVHDAVQAPAAIAAGSAMAEALGVPLPVVQGPMTRVSDQAGFAAAVSDGGGLPFIALALADAEQTRRMLTETAAALGERPWGVGVLGFAPERVRGAQLEVIAELAPKLALIAGGRPDQAKALEDQGISTFLHVPSPRLLEQYLAAGARKFVFEGSECGGHVGPRTSFALWQAQLSVLLDWVENGGDPAELQLLFAGGIHDARSSAMVSALTASLTGSGAAVGVLMGTGYLFTAEAVANGAVGEIFQQHVVDAQRTALLETAPGHATRCVESPFVDAFHAAREEMTAAGLEQREVWERLEELNVGRLRIASKGLVRDGSELVSVSSGEQRELGMFMAGQVATLRSSLTTVADLHHDVTERATTFLDDRVQRLRATMGTADAAPRPQPVDVAIVGMAAVYPGAADVAQFWANVLANIDSVTEVSRDRWDPEVFYADPATKDGPPRGDWTPSKWGGFLPKIPFDPLRYGIPPSALPAIDTAQLLALYVSDGALADAGYRENDFDHARTGVVFATAQGSDLKNANTLRMLLPGYVGSVPEQLKEQLPTLSEDSLPGQLGSVVAGRVANRLDLG